MSTTSSPARPSGARAADYGKGARQPVAAADFASAAQAKQVCPFCGAINDRQPVDQADAPACPRCSMQDTAATRQATKVRIGPWFVRQSRNPSAPGMRFETLLTLVKRGQVNPGSVVRGPTTHQLWRFAAQVKGLSREFGLCYSCGGAIDSAATLCPACNRMQEPPVNPDVLLETPVAPAGATAGATSAPAPLKPAAPAPLAPPATPAAKHLKPAAPQLPPPRPRGGLRRGEEILTARELAAAFQLDFVPANERSKFDEWHSPRKLGRSAAIIVLLLLAAGVAGALVKRPDWRQKASTWAGDAYSSVKGIVASASAKSDADEQTGPRPATLPDHASAIQSGAEEDGLPSQPSVYSGSLRVDPREVEPDATTTTVRTQPLPREIEDPPVAIPFSSSQAPRPTVNATPTAPATDTAPAPVSASMSAADQLDQARTLYRQAIEAERKRPSDYAEAVRLYEQVKKMPREVWPGDLEIRLERARRSIK